MAGINTLTVLYLTSLAGLGQALVYFLLLKRTISNEQRAWLAYQVLMGVAFLILAAGLLTEPTDFYVFSALLLLTAYLARFIAIAQTLGASFTKRSLGIGAGVIVFVGVLFTWCHSLGAPLGSLETIVLLPLGVASGLSAKYLWDRRNHGVAGPMFLIGNILWLECAVFGVLAIGALAGIGQDYVHPESFVTTTIALIAFVIQLVLPILWVIHAALEKQEIFSGVHKASTSIRSFSKSGKAVATPANRTSAKRVKDGDLNASNIDALDAAQASHLTAKELEVLQLVVAGKKNKEIAVALQISEASVKVHKSRMTNKLGVRTLPELTLALQQLQANPVHEQMQPDSVEASSAVETQNQLSI